jgi:uncharacterized protein (DUF362 family)
MAEATKIFIDHLTDDYITQIRKGFLYIDIASKVKPGDTVFIKPNLTFPYYREGVMTHPRCVEHLVHILKDYSVKIIIGESDSGGYNRFSMDEVFEKTGLKTIEKKYSIRLVNLSKMASRNINFHYNNREFSVPLPQLLLDEVQLFITVPVPKVHANTGVSMSIKNQWGCIQEPSMRLKLHPYFKKVILEINKALNVRVSVIDGRYGLNKNGPMRGEALELKWLMVADNILAADMVCSTLMGIDPCSVKYLRFYANNEKKTGFEDFQFNQDHRKFIGPKFYLQREFWDYPGYFAFRSSFLAYLAYQSPLARILHKVLYLFREKFYQHD